MSPVLYLALYELSAGVYRTAEMTYATEEAANQAAENIAAMKRCRAWCIWIEKPVGLEVVN